MPPKIANAPQLLPGLAFYFNAFLILSSCRPMGMTEGRIPATAVFAYAQHLGLPEDETDDLWIVVSQMDTEYIKFRQKQSKSQ